MLQFISIKACLILTAVNVLFVTPAFCKHNLKYEAINHENNATEDVPNPFVPGKVLQHLFNSFFKWVHNFLTGSDPYNYTYLSLDYRHILCNSTGYLKNIIISELSRLNLKPIVKDTEYQSKKYVRLSVDSETFQLTTDYSLDLNTTDNIFQLNGDGQFGIATTGFKATIEMYIWIFHDGRIFIKWSEIEYDIQDIKVQIDGLYYDRPLGKVISKIINLIAVRILRQYKEPISIVLSLFSNLIVNRNLNGLTIHKIIDFINHIIGT